MPNYNYEREMNQYNLMQSLHGDVEREKQTWIIRFNDLIPSAKERVAKAFQNHSSIYTLRANAKEGQIKGTLETLNPILMLPGFRGDFSYSYGLHRWREKIISSAIFNYLFRTHPKSFNPWETSITFKPTENFLNNINFRSD